MTRRTLYTLLNVPENASAVTVMAAGAPRQIMNEWTTVPEQILDTFVAEIRANMRHYSIWPGNYALVVPPQLRAHFDAAGWSKTGGSRQPRIPWWSRTSARRRSGSWWRIEIPLPSTTNGG